MKKSRLNLKNIHLSTLLILNIKRILALLILGIVLYYGFFIYTHFINVVVLPAPVAESDIIARQVKVDLNLFQSILNNYTSKMDQKMASRSELSSPFDQ